MDPSEQPDCQKSGNERSPPGLNKLPEGPSRGPQTICELSTRVINLFKHLHLHLHLLPQVDPFFDFQSPLAGFREAVVS